MTKTHPRGLDRLWPDGRPLVGMVHLLPLPGSPGWAGSMAEILERALADARLLENGGLDGILVENFLDVPFFGGPVPPETVAAMGRIVGAVADAAGIPVGVNVLRNDARAALGVAVAAGARFIRVNVHTGTMWTDQGRIDGDAAGTLRARRLLDGDVAILADVMVKHATPPPGLAPADAAGDAWHRGLADALVVSGAATGAPTPGELIADVKEAVPAARVLVGSGVTPDTVAGVLDAADGAIVGSTLTRTGRAGTGIDADAVARLVEAAERF